MIAACLFGVVTARAAVFSADAVKAAFLFRFASYVTWPPDAPVTGPFVIGVMNDDAVAEHLNRLLPGMNVRGQPAEVRRITKATELDGVHILYVAHGNGAPTREIRAKATRLPILLVTDREDGFEAGGVINFIDVPSNVRFEISLIAADRSRLEIDSALLAVAARVERRPHAYLPCVDCARVAAP